MLKNRFLSVFVLAFAAGIAMPFLLGTGMEAVAFLSLLCVFLPAIGISTAVFLFRKKGKAFLLYLSFVGVGFCLGAGWLWVRSLPYQDYVEYEQRADVIEGTVTESGSSADSSYLELKVDRSHIGLPEGTVIRLYSGSTGNIHIGDRVRAECDYGRVTKASYRANSVALTANGSVISHKQDDSLLNIFRNTLLDACEKLYAPYDSVGVAQALTVRERSLLPLDTAEGYRNAGVAHLLAISGLHLSILVMLLRRMLLAFRLRKLTRECIALLVILLYCILTGFSPSIVRASVMLGFVLLGEIFLDETDSITVLFLALLLLLLANPYSLLSIGLQLSFLSCLGILLLSPHISDLQKKLRGDSKSKHRALRRCSASLAGSFLISTGAVAFTFPVSVISFGNLSYLAPLANMVLVPLFTPILALLLLSVLLYPLLPFLGYGLAAIPGVALLGMDKLFALLLDAQIGTVIVEGAFVAIPVVLSGLAVAAMLLLPKKSVSVFLACSVCAMVSVPALVFLHQEQTPLSVTVSAAEGYVYLWDGETSLFADAGELPAGHPRELSSSLEVYLVTRADETALARLRGILQQTEVQQLYLPIADSAGQGNDLSPFLSLAEAYGCAVHQYRYAVETELLRYDVREGRIEIPYETTVLLSGGIPSQKEQACIILSTNIRIPVSHEGVTFYLPASYKGEAPANGEIAYYTHSITFQNGEVTTP